MIFSRKDIDRMCPTHDMTSCSDENPKNGAFDVEEIRFRGVVVEKKWRYEPECKRCFLLENIDIDLEISYGIVIKPTIEIQLEQPDIEIVIKGKK